MAGQGDIGYLWVSGGDATQVCAPGVGTCSISICIDIRHGTRVSYGICQFLSHNSDSA